MFTDHINKRKIVLFFVVCANAKPGFYIVLMMATQIVLITVLSQFEFH